MTIASRLGLTGRRSTVGVTIHFASGKWARADLDSEDDRITSMTLVPKTDEKGAMPSAIEAFTRRFRVTDKFAWEWGSVKFDLGNNQLAFHVRRKGNSIAARQVDAARQVLVEAAFGVRVRASDQELAEVLGAGPSP
jgi:hypothetical protein